MIYLVYYRTDAAQAFRLHTRTRNRFRAIYWSILLSAGWNEWNVKTVQRQRKARRESCKAIS